MELSINHWLIRWYIWLQTYVYRNGEFYIQCKLGLKKDFYSFYTKVNFCELMRATIVWPTVIVSAFIGFVTFVTMTAYTAGGLFNVLAVWTGTIGGILVFVGLIFSIIKYMEWRETRLEKLMEKNGGKLPPTPIKDWLKSQKNKVCPMMKITKDEVKE